MLLVLVRLQDHPFILLEVHTAYNCLHIAERCGTEQCSRVYVEAAPDDLNHAILVRSLRCSDKNWGDFLYWTLWLFLLFLLRLLLRLFLLFVILAVLIFLPLFFHNFFLYRFWLGLEGS